MRVEEIIGERDITIVAQVQRFIKLQYWDMVLLCCHVTKQSAPASGKCIRHPVQHHLPIVDAPLHLTALWIVPETIMDQERGLSALKHATEHLGRLWRVVPSIWFMGQGSACTALTVPSILSSKPTVSPAQQSSNPTIWVSVGRLVDTSLKS